MLSAKFQMKARPALFQVSHNHIKREKRKKKSYWRSKLDNGNQVINGYAGCNTNNDEREDEGEDAQSELGRPHAAGGDEDGAHDLALRLEWLLLLLLVGLVLRDGLLLALLVYWTFLVWLLLLLWRRRGRRCVHDGQISSSALVKKGDGNQETDIIQ
jgi:hypothetical protein